MLEFLPYTNYQTMKVETEKDGETLSDFKELQN
jgi:hypothetical protein